MPNESQKPRENYIEINGNELCWFEWNEARDDESTILLVHATGFHGRCWDQVVKHLGGRHVIALEMRGHGRSGNKGPFTWNVFGEDIIEFINKQALSNLVAAGHSMGGYALVHAMAEEQSRFARAILIDPVIMDPEVYAANDNIQEGFLDDAGMHPVARRRNNFDNVEAMFKNFEGRGSYGLWEKAVLHDYCEYGLLPDPDGLAYVLACPPVVEASIYMGSSALDIFQKISEITLPVTVMRAEQRVGDRAELDFSKSPTMATLANKFADGRDVYLPELTHFIPMQAPSLVATYLLEE